MIEIILTEEIRESSAKYLKELVEGSDSMFHSFNEMKEEAQRNVRKNREALAWYHHMMLQRARDLCHCLCQNKQYLYKMLLRDGGFTNSEEKSLLSADKWPKHLSFHREVDGIWFTLYPSGQSPKSLLRLYVDCPMCGKHVSAGRLRQHAKIHR